LSTKGNHWALNVRGVGPAKKAILFALGERHNRDTDLCFPDQTRLAEDAEMGVRTLQGHLNELERMGLIERQVKSPSGRGRLTFYTLRFDRLRPVEGWENQSAESADGSEDQSADSDMTKAQLSAFSGNPNLEPESSVPNGTDAKGVGADLFPETVPPPKLKEEDPYKRLIFDAGLRLLTSAKIAEPSARAFLGKLIGQAGTVIVANAITACQQENPVDPRGWLQKVVNKRAPAAPPTVQQEAEDELRRLHERFHNWALGGNWPSHWGPRPNAPDADYPDELYETYAVKRWEGRA